MADKIRRYEMCTDSNIWKDEIENVLENGYFIADMGSNWDLWRLGDMTYSLAKEGTGASPSFWCHTSKLRAHLYELKRICRYDTLIPPDWSEVDLEFLATLGIKQPT